VGPGGSQDAAYPLRADVPAGAYHVECDAIITDPVDVTFSLILRRGAADTTLAEWTRHWDPLAGGGYDAQAYEVDEVAPAIEFEPGDQLVFRYAGANAASPNAFIPNGDGASAHGRIPSITLPR
jgi:FtsP/CotA-like multicopper oxidase with cupredoxin domain